MRKNQKFTREEMYMAIELWKESDLSQKNYCNQNNLSFSTFKYWQKKYQADRQGKKPKLSKPFIPIHIPQPITTNLPEAETGIISINYPNGVVVNCPTGISIEQIRGLIKL
jgi:transposase-like protein